MSYLELITRQDAAEGASITQEMIDGLREVLAESGGSGYDVDAALFHLAVAVVNIQAALLEQRAEIISLERRIIEAGLHLGKAE